MGVRGRREEIWVHRVVDFEVEKEGKGGCDRLGLGGYSWLGGIRKGVSLEGRRWGSDKWAWWDKSEEG